jgi:probable biosynthetic protein (TIGR04098 family)
MVHQYDLRLGLPHTNARGLSEPLLMQQAGHAQWAAIATAINLPLSKLRTRTGGEVYATFYYIETEIPPSAPLESFQLDDEVRFLLALRAFKNLSIEGQLLFDRPERLGAARWTAESGWSEPSIHPRIHFGNIFITPMKGNSVLRVAPPANADFSAFDPLPNAENPYRITKAAAESGTLGLFDGWRESGEPFVLTYSIDEDRDTNGAGLVYFANYVTFMETAERAALGRLAPGAFADDAIPHRSLRRRRIGYYGNVDVNDSLTIDVQVMTHPASAALIGLRFVVRRAADAAIICRSEAIKALPASS